MAMSNWSESTTLSTSEVAVLFGVDRRTILRWVAAGGLPAIQPYPRAHRRFRADDVARLLEGGTS